MIWLVCFVEVLLHLGRAFCEFKKLVSRHFLQEMMNMLHIK